MARAAAFYNDIDPFPCIWARELMAAGVIVAGTIEQRSIASVSPEEVSRCTQVHLFSGIGAWSLALRLAGWPDDCEVWTGSCPCQPFSQSGRQRGEEDPRHLWPQMRRLIAECRPATIFGEQVASKLGREWLARVRLDLEALGYAVGCSDLPAAGVSSPHKRQRLWWGACRLGDATSKRRDWPGLPGETAAQEGERGRSKRPEDGRDERGGLGNADSARRERWGVDTGEHGDQCAARSTSESGCGMGDTEGPGRGARRIDGARDDERAPESRGSGDDLRLADSSGTAAIGVVGIEDSERSQLWFESGSRSDIRGLAIEGWGDCWVECSDGFWRRIPRPDTKPWLLPLVDAGSFRGRVAVLRGAGNAIVPAVAAIFIKSFSEACREAGFAR